MIELLTEEKEKFESRQSRSYSPMGYTWTLGVGRSLPFAISIVTLWLRLRRQDTTTLANAMSGAHASVAG